VALDLVRPHYKQQICVVMLDAAACGGGSANGGRDVKMLNYLVFNNTL
jgi:hypothetical protein